MTTPENRPTMRQRLSRAGTAIGITTLGLATIGGGFALWQDTEILPTAHDFQTGSLSVEALGDGEWVDEATGAPMAETPAYPGARFVFTESVEVGIDGNLRAELGMTELEVTGAGDLPELVETDQIITVNGQPVEGPLTSADDGLLPLVELSVEIPEDVEVGMGETISIGTVEVWLQQVTD